MLYDALLVQEKFRKSHVSITRNGYAIIWIIVLDMMVSQKVEKFPALRDLRRDLT